MASRPGPGACIHFLDYLRGAIVTLAAISMNVDPIFPQYNPEVGHYGENREEHDQGDDNPLLFRILESAPVFHPFGDNRDDGYRNSHPDEQAYHTDRKIRRALIFRAWTRF